MPRDVVDIDREMRTLQLQKTVSLSRKVMAEEGKTKLDTNRASGIVSPINFNTYQNIIEHEQTKIQDILNRLTELRSERYSALREARNTGRVSPFFVPTDTDVAFIPIEPNIEPNIESSIINNGINFYENNNFIEEEDFNRMGFRGGKKKSKRKRSKSKSKTRKVKKGKGKTFKKKQRKPKRKTKRKGKSKK